METKSMKRKTKEPIKPSNSFYCCDCDETIDAKDFKQHLISRHNITETKGTRQMRMHMDAADHFISEYEVTIGGMSFIQSVLCPRSKNDLLSQ